MTIHQFNPNKLPDSFFEKGSLEFLVIGNECSLLDPRRTPGVIEDIFEESGMFRWRIRDFEDKGKFWDMKLEEIDSFQFEKNSKLNESKKVNQYAKLIEKFDEKLEIKIDQRKRRKAQKKIEDKAIEAFDWIYSNSKFINSNSELNFDSRVGPKSLLDDMQNYMKSQGLLELEKKTSETYVLNPNSGEWMKGIEITMAQIGLRSFFGKIPRTKDIFKGDSSEEKRSNFIIARVAFLKAIFSNLDLEYVSLFRGIRSNHDSKYSKKTFSSWTFSEEVVSSFIAGGSESTIMEEKVPVDRLFMTFLETKAMNNQYLEAEAVVLEKEVKNLAFVVCCASEGE